MSNAPKWITAVLENTELCRIDVDARSLDDIANEIAEAFPVRACMDAAAASLTAQLKRNGIDSISATELRAIAANMVQAIAGAVQAPNTEATEFMREHIEAATILGNVGIPWGDKLPARVRALAEARPFTRDVGAAALERLRAAHRGFWKAYEAGAIDVECDVEEGAGTCPGDDTCTCQGPTALNELQHAIDAIAGRIDP